MKMGLASKVKILVFSSIILLGLTGLSRSQSIETNASATVFDQVGKEVSKIFEKSKDSVIKVKSFIISQETDPKGTTLEATGFFIDDNGTILTTYSVLRGAESTWIEIGDKRYDAKVIGADPRSRVAMLKINYKSKAFLDIANSGNLEIGRAVLSIGYPYNLPSSPNFGFIGGFDTKYQENFFVTTHIRANLPISPGQAGSPLLTSDGKVVGMLVAGMEDGKACYALPSNAIKKVKSDMEKYNGDVKHAWVGVNVIKAAPVADERTVVIRNLNPGTPAEQSGLQNGDVVLKIDNYNIREPKDVLDASFYAKVGEPITITVLRDGKKVESTVTLTTRPATSQSVEKLPTSLAPENFDKLQIGGKLP
ncbi:MAG: S1C family serine protease [Verrucomicrobiota bacterium]|nr:S1C family serine protease [Verrucomicrobiota bacterium]